MTSVAIIGAGPYGLSIAAHFRRDGIPFRIFGRAMDSWVSHMPKGMLLKSDGFACNLYDPDGDLTLKTFCAGQGIEYADAETPVHLKTFTDYGLAFKNRMVPELEESLIVGLDRSQQGFILRLDNGDVVNARHVVLAVGITHFQHIPKAFADLSQEFVSHSFSHHNLEPFRGRSVIVVGGGASAIDLAGLLRDSDADVQLVARKPSLQFHTRTSVNESSSWLQRIRNPRSGIGSGVKLRFFAEAPMWFHHLPERIRLDEVRNSLGPSGGWFAKEKVMGRIPLRLGCTPENVEVRAGRVHLQVRTAAGARQEIVAEHIISATGYQTDLNQLKFVSAEIISTLKTVEGTPILSSTFESSIPGLYFVGMAAANSFGPVLRFAYGARFAARRLSRQMKKSLARGRAAVSVPAIAENRQPLNKKSTRLVIETSVLSKEKKGPASARGPEARSLRVLSGAAGRMADTSARSHEKQ